MTIIKLIATVKHFIRVAPTEFNMYGTVEPEQIQYDYDEDFIFIYDMKTLKLKGSGWSKEVTPEEVADTIKAYFAGTCYHLADIVQLLE